MITEKIFALSRKFPDIGLRSSKIAKYTKIFPDLNEGSFLSFSLVCSLFMGLAFGWFFIADLIYFFIVFFIGFGLGFFIISGWPESEANKRLRKMEAMLPLILRNLAMLLGLGVPFFQAMKMASHNNVLFASAIIEVEQGASIQRALAGIAEDNPSSIIKRAVTQMISAYEQGGNNQEIKRISDELISLQKYNLRDYASKSSLFGLIFVIFTTVVPTFFLVLSTVGKAALGIEIPAGLFVIAFVVVFPLIDLLILTVAGSQVPPSLFGETEKKQYVVFGFAIVLAALMLLNTNIVLKVIVFGLFASLWLVFFGNEYLHGRKTEKIEAVIPDSLLAVSGLPKSYGLEKIFSKMGDVGNEFSEEAKKTARQLKANVNPEKALDDIGERTSSPMVKRVCRLMLDSQRAGSNISERMHEVAEDLMMFAELKRERENALAIQKYTLLAGAILIPLILSTSFTLASKIGNLVGEGGEILNVASGAINAYLVLYSVISAAYIANMKGKDSVVAPYFFGLAALSLMCFYIISLQMN
ncbi:type II secretion system F family protein [Candidatus Micrarchaeota archaeon]|nr:type II secretion system F family protein [Candidatus Micrarchaeota archaeon]